MIYIGIDQSLSFTGITIIKRGDPTFIGVTHKTHTKWDKLKDKPDNVKVIDYKYIDKSDDYIENERVKYTNIRTLVDIIENILKGEREKDEVEVRMEGIAFSARNTSALAELAGLNFMIRDVCSRLGIPFTILTPGTVKKYATGNGQADKELMLASFFAVHSHLKPLEKVLKMDDIADSYFMASWVQDR